MRDKPHSQPNALQLVQGKRKKKKPFEELDLIEKCSVMAEKAHMSYGNYYAKLQQLHPFDPHPAATHFSQAPAEKKDDRAILCRFCGKPFVQGNPKRIYCSAPCQEGARRVREKYISGVPVDENIYYKPEKYITEESQEYSCAVCGKHFRSTSNRSLYCSPRCRNRAAEARAKERAEKK